MMRLAHKSFCLFIGAAITMVAFSAQATSVIYTLNSVTLADGEQTTGTFEWTYSDGDFEGGSGAFTALDIPYTTFYTFELGNLNVDIQTDAIEISGDGSFHDAGLDITMKFVQPFAATQSASMDLGLSFFECCGNGFKDQNFQSGSIVPGAHLAGDFDLNDVVDGHDFLKWQRGESPDSLSQADLDRWEANFGVTPTKAVTSPAPEPPSVALVAIACLAIHFRRRSA